jgi:hypothetical protein
MRHHNVSEPHGAQLVRRVGIPVFRIFLWVGLVILAIIWTVGVFMALGVVARSLDVGIQGSAVLLLLGLVVNIMVGYWAPAWILSVVPQRWLFKDEDAL